MKKEQAALIDMAKYNESEEIHDKCIGCNKVFDHISTSAGSEIAVIVPKCLTYIRPAMWWEKKSIATRKELIISKANPKGIWVEMPAVVRVCPVATHIEVEITTEGVKVNPLKASKRAGR